MGRPWDAAQLLGGLSDSALDLSDMKWFYGLSGGYGFIALVATVQLIRIQLRVPEYGWTTQKVFHLLNFSFCAMRCAVFALRDQVEHLPYHSVQTVLLDLPGLIFFSTYTLLVLFWAEIYHQARSLPTSRLRPAFFAGNALAYGMQIALWVYMGVAPHTEPLGTCRIVSGIFMAAVSVIAALGFVVYGGRVFMMLYRFPIESRGRRRKLVEVGCVTAICATCFVVRAVMVAYTSYHDKQSRTIDVLSHPLLNVVYYSCVEILPSALVLYILRKLPPRRTDGYQSVVSWAFATGPMRQRRDAR